MCLFALVAGMFPRIAFGIYWIARPSVVNAAFGTFVWPILGFFLLPFTTLMYTILWTTNMSVSGWDWLWVGIALLLDLGHYGASAYGNRSRIPGVG